MRAVVASVRSRTIIYLRTLSGFVRGLEFMKKSVPNSRPGKGLEMRQKHEKVWKITLA